MLSFIIPEVEKTVSNGLKDFKTQLQERFQKYSKQTPRYQLISKTGPDHDQTFEVSVQLGDKTFGPAKGKTKKEAEQLAAQIALQKYDFTSI